MSTQYQLKVEPRADIHTQAYYVCQYETAM